MAVFECVGVRIAGISTAVPDNCVSVESYTPIFGKEATEKFSNVTGIHSVHKALPEQTASDLAFVACENLLSKNHIKRDDIGALFFVTQSPDYRRPSTACVLQKRLGLGIDCAAFELTFGCSGFVYGLQTAISTMVTSDVRYALLLIGETASKLVDPKDKSIVMMYGDAGTAILLEKDGDTNIQTLLRSDGSRFKAIILPAGGFRDMYPPHDKFMCSDGIERSLYDVYMDGTSVFSFSISDVPVAIKDYLAHTQTSPEDYDAFVFHQANVFIIKQLMRKMRLDQSKVPISLDRYGNTGGISIPLTLCDAYGKMPDKSIRVLGCGFGIGLSWGVTSFEIDTNTVFPIIKTTDYYAEGKIKPGDY